MEKIVPAKRWYLTTRLHVITTQNSGHRRKLKIITGSHEVQVVTPTSAYPVKKSDLLRKHKADL
jgi:hypothetical protein